MANTIGKYAKPAYPVGTYAGGRVVQAAYGTHTQVGASSAADTLDICKLPAGAEVLRADVTVNGAPAVVADITVGYVGAPAAFSTIERPVLTPGTEDTIVRLTSVGAADFPDAGDILCIVYYVFEQPKPV